MNTESRNASLSRISEHSKSRRKSKSLVSKNILMHSTRLTTKRWVPSEATTKESATKFSSSTRKRWRTSALKWRNAASVRFRRLKFVKTKRLRSVQLSTSKSIKKLRTTTVTLPPLTLISLNSWRKTSTHPTRKLRHHKKSTAETTTLTRMSLNLSTELNKKNLSFAISN